MMKQVALGIVGLLALVGCGEDAAPGVDTSAITQTSSPTEPGFYAAPGFNVGDRKNLCPYSGGCEGTVHPTSGRFSVDGKDCGIDGKAATLDMDPVDGIQNLEWRLESAASACGILHVAGGHFERYPQTGRVTVGGSDRTDVKLASGPTSHVPSKIEGKATVDGHAIAFTFSFGDE